MSLSYEPDNNKVVIDQALAAYDVLTDEQKHIIERKYIQGVHTAQEWLEVLRGIAEYDALGDDAKKVAKPTYAGCIVVAIGFLGAFFLANFVNASEQFIFLFIILIIFVGLGLMIYRVFNPSAHHLLKQRDLPNHFRSFALPVLVLLKEEVDGQEPIALWVDMRKKNQPENKIQKKEPRPIKDTQTTFFRHYLVTIKTRFVDGTRFYLEVGDVVRQRVRRRYNARGKLKVKTKYKTKTQWRLKIALPKQHYTLLQKTGMADEMSDSKRIIFKLQQGEIQTSFDYVPNINLFMKMVAEVYKKVKRT